MPILNFGEKLPSVYLDKFAPAENVPTLISVLDTSKVIGLEYHWVDFPTLGIRGCYRCHGGLCCSMFGVRNQSMNVPIYVYKNPQASTEGELQNWSLTKTTYQQLVELASRYDLSKYDLEITATRQGKGLRQSMTVVPNRDATHLGMRDYMDPTQVAQIQEQINAYFSMAEEGMTRDMSDQEWLQFAQEVGYDVVNHCWLNGTKPMSPQASRGAVTGMARNPLGIAPQQVANSIPNRGLPQLGTPISYPNPTIAPQPTPITQAPASPVTPIQPAQPVVNAQTTPTQPVVPQAPVQPVAPVTPQPVTPQPVPTPPITPHPVSITPVPTVEPEVHTSAPNPFTQAINNVVTGAAEMTSSELDSLLDSELG